MGSQAAAFAFATPVGAPSRGATGGRRIARGGALGDGERRVSCAAASGSRAGFPASRGGPSQKDTSTGWARRQDARVAGARGERLRLRRAPSAVSHREGSLDASCDEGDVGNDETGAARASGASPLGTATAAQTNPSASSSSSRVVEFVAAWDALSPRLAAAASSGAAFVPPGAAADGLAPDARGNREMLLGALKLAIPRLQAIPEDRRRPGGSPRSGAPERALSDGNDETSVKRHRPAHERAVAVTLALCDVGMDAECMSAALLRDALVAGSVTLEEIEAGLGSNVMRLTHDCVRLRRLPGRVTGSYDDATAEKLRTFCLSFHDVRAVVVELAYRADALRDFENTALSAVQRTALALETMQLYAPMAHALDAGPLCAELEDLALRALFPSSYRSLEKWLRGAGPADDAALERARRRVAEALAQDPGLMTLVGGPAGVAVKARRKSLFSTMKKVLRDGRAREDVHDLLGMRVIVTPQPGSPAYAEPDAPRDDAAAAAAERSALAACYRVREITHGLFETVDGRTKDYLRRPKENGYRSLHSTLRLPEAWKEEREADGEGGEGSSEASESGEGSSEASEARSETKRRNDDEIDDELVSSTTGDDDDDTSSASDEDASGGRLKNFGRVAPIERRVELQVRTAAMHFAAESGAAKHAAYKGGFSEDPGAADALAELVAAANAAAEQRFGAFADSAIRLGGDAQKKTAASPSGSPSADASHSDRVFRMFDLDGDGRVTRDELRSVIGEVWRGPEMGTDDSDASARYASPFTSADDEGVAADELLEMLDADEDGTVSAEEFARFAASLRAIGSLPGADAATAAAIEGSIASTSRPRARETRDARREDDRNDENKTTKTAGRSEAGANDKNVNDVSAVSADVDGELVVSENFSRDDDEHSDDTRVRDDEKHKKHKKHLIEDALAALADASAMAAPPLPPAPPPPRVRGGDAAARDAGKALREKAGGIVEWQLVWDLTRAGRPETARELFYQRTSKTPDVTGLWEQWARFELMQGDAERARGLYRAALLHAEGRPRARAESLRKWAVMEFGADNRVAADGLFERALRVLDDAERAAAAAEEGLEDAEAEVREETESQTESAASLRRAQAVVLSSWAQAASRGGDAAVARKYLARAMARDPGNVKAAHALARLEELRGDDTAAEALYREILRLRPGEAHASVSLARLLAETRGDVGGARDAFVAAARANPENHKVLQSWAVMEAKQGGFPAKGVDSVDGVLTKSVDVGKKRGDTDLADLDVDALAGLAAARRLFQRAAFLAPWSAPVWCAWAAAEFRATGDCATARELYAKGLDADPTNTWCLRGLGEAELAAGRVAQARDYLERALDLEPRNRRCVTALARLEDASGNKARAARYFNVARELLKEQKREEADLIASGRVALRGGSRGVWAPAEAAAAARGVAALNAAEGASYRRADAEGGEAGGGRSAFRAVLAAARGEAAAAKARDRGGREVGARRRAAWRRGDRDAAAEEKTRAAPAPGPGGPGPGGAIGSSLDGIGSSLDDAIGSSLDGIGSSLDDDARAAGTARRPGRNVASELDMDAEFDAVTRERAWVSFASGDEDALERERWGDDAESVDGTVDSMDDDLRRYTGEGRG